MVELQRGLALALQQFKALLKKNLLLSWRNKRSTSLQLFSSLFFIFLIFCIQKALDSRFSDTTSFDNVFDPNALVSPPIPPCEDKFQIRLPCFDFVWSGNSSRRIQSVVASIMANNPGRTIPSSKVKSFGTPDEVDQWLINNPMHCPGALHFMDRNATILSYGIQTNSTSVTKRGKEEDPTFKFQIPLQIAAEREIARTLLGDPGFSWEVGLKEFAHPAIYTFNAVAVVGPIFFLAIAMFGFESQITALVTEKELKLRQFMSIMGLYDSTYWFSWFIWEAFMRSLSSLLIVLFGMMFQFNFFLHNSFAILFLLFFLFQLAMTSFAFMISTFITKSSSATTIGLFTFIIGFLTQIITLFGFPYEKEYSSGLRAIWSLFPPNLFSKAVKLLGDETATPEGDGISWRRRADCPSSNFDCVITVDGLLRWLLGTFLLWFLLAIYFDNINPNSSGVRKSPLYFLRPSYWTGKGGNKVEEGGVCSCARTPVPPENASPDDEDVLEEENAVKQQVTEKEVDPNVAVQIRGLVKTYPGTRSAGCCKRRTSPYHAIKGLWVNLTKDQLFCLLGPNGAGKTTVINCLTGITPSTGGDALIYGYSIQSSVGLSMIQKMIGVCPQFDVLWDVLSGQEHLHLFASIKGLPPYSIKSVIRQSLTEVKLDNAANIRSSSYSGGMKRRLSFAIALIGDPKLVILDEPTTGMDPISRRHVWDLIENAKKGRAIILTTHSMEEADILGDRIAIMAKGKLRCIGTSIRLKSRFGTGFVANINFQETTPEMNIPAIGNAVATTEAHHEAVKQFFKFHLHVEPKDDNKAFITFVIPHEKEALLSKFFEELQDREAEFGISNIQLSLTTLEEVFLNIAKKAELESAISEGTLVALHLTSGVSLQIPRGARFIGIPGTESTENPRGVMVEVYWEQDETGSLCISGHSAETPIPTNVQPTSSSITRAHRTFWGRSRGIHGLVINPDQVGAPNSQQVLHVR